ncbi:C-reactive protein-like [Macrobrachium rosenbergii]|uniref:C-reactive protein-like n=1 Tax=Macrobrachium rosenbergii TaxID=79674 RepID=UPI0034D6AA34
MGRRVFEEGWMVLFMYVAALWTPEAVSGIKNSEELRMSSGYRKGGQRIGLAKQGLLSETNINSELSVTQKLCITSGTQNVPVVNEKSAPKRLLTASVAYREEQKEKWMVPLADVQPEKGCRVPLLEFQRDYIMSANTFAMYNASWPNLQNFSLSFWINVYNWRYYSQIVSYALGLRRDNALLITQSQTGLEYRKDDIYFSVPWEDDVAYILEWMHICLVVSSTAHKLYIDGIEVLNKKITRDSSQYAGDPLIVLEGGGLLVLGQDQDKPGGGFEPKHSLSGSIADFQLFATILTPKDIRALYEFQVLPHKSLLDLTDQKWLFQNIQLSDIKTEPLFEMKVTGKFFLFFRRSEHQ